MKVPPHYLPRTERVQLIARPNLFSTDVVMRTAPAGETLVEMLARVGIDPALPAHMVLRIDDHEIARQLWGRVRPKPGTCVTIGVLPAGGGGGGKNPLRLILQIAVVAAAIAVGPALGAAAAPVLGLSEAVATGLAQGAIGLVGSLLVNAIAPPPRPRNLGSDSVGRQALPQYGVAGSTNRATPYGPVPVVLGKHRIWPPYGAAPYTEIVGNDQYLRLCFAFQGPCRISELKIGDQALSVFKGVAYETREGWPTDVPLTLFPGDVAEQALQVELSNPSGWHTRTTAPDVDEISVDVNLPNGVVRIDPSGDHRTSWVWIRIQYRLLPAGDWVEAPMISVTAASPDPLRRGQRWAVARGQYEVRLWRSSPDDAGQLLAADTIFNQAYWTALRGTRNEDPIAVSGMAKIALRIKATDQLNGVIDDFNCIAESYALDWVGTGWIQQVTRNPASLFRHVLQGAANRRPVADTRIDLARLAAWHTYCAGQGFTFDGVVDWRGTVAEVLDTIAAAGRAGRTGRDGKFAVTVDQVHGSPLQMFTPRNSRGLRWRKEFRRAPHGVRVRFIDPDTGWQASERIVYADGYGPGNATDIEDLELTGVTDSALAWRHGRYHMAVARLRPVAYELETDIEHILVGRGDPVALSHDVLLFALGAARIKSVSTGGGGEALGVTLDEPVPMEAGGTYGLAVRIDDGTIVTAAVATAAGEQTVLTFTAAVAAGQIEAGQLASFGERGAETIQCIVRSVEPGPDLSARLVLVDAAPAVHTADTGTIPAYDPQITRPPDVSATVTVPVITGVRSDETVLDRAPDGALVPRIVVAIAARTGAGSLPEDALHVQVRRADAGEADWRPRPPAPGDAPSVAIGEVEEGRVYDLRIRAVTRAGRSSDWAVVTGHTVIGRTTLPPDVPRLLIEGDRLSWDYPAPPRDLAGFRVRHRTGSARTWDDATPAHGGLITDTGFDVAALPGGQRTLLVKAVDVAGNESAAPAVLVRDLGDPIVDNVVLSDDRQAAGWPGALTGGSDIAGTLHADGTSAFWGAAGTPFWDPDPEAVFWTGSFAQMVFEDALTPPAEALPATLTIDHAVDGDPWAIEYRTGGDSQFWGDDPDAPFWPASGGTAFWPPAGEWRPWPGALAARRQRYDIRITTGAGPVQGLISELVFVLDVPDITETVADVAIAAGGTRLALAQPFRFVTAVNLTLQGDGGDAVTARVVDKAAPSASAAGPLIKCFDAAGDSVAGNVDGIVQGY